MPPVVSISKISPNADRVAILVNPKAGPIAAQPRADRLAHLLKEQNFKVEVFTDLAAVASQANQWHADGSLRALVGVGGDGTAAELVNRTNEGVPITLLPGGNSNLLAVYLGLTKNPEQVCRVIADGYAARLDAGRANGRIFLLMVGCGFDAEVVNRVHGRRTGHISLKNYLGPVREVIHGYEYPEIRAEWEVDGQPGKTYSARWMFVFNLPCYGGGFRIAPHSDGADGQLDLCGLQQGRFWKYFAAIQLRLHRFLTDWSTHRVRRVRITSDAKVPYQLDGDPGGWLPLDVEVLPKRMTLIVPKEAVPSKLSKSAMSE